MPVWLQQLISVLLWIYVGYQLVSGRTMSWGKEPGAILNGRWVHRDEQPVAYWVVLGLTVCLVAAMTYGAFVR